MCIRDRLYALPQIYDGSKHQYCVTIRQDWLDALGLQMPTTVQELYDVAYAFTYNDPDKNGLNDTVGLTATKGMYVFDTIMGSFDTVLSNQIIIRDGKVTNTLLQPGMVDGLKWCKKFVDDKLIDPDCVTTSGAEKFTIGLCKKVLLANSIGGLWDSAFATPAQELSVLGAILGVAAFTFQIYFDFSGYSDMAVGLGRMLGFEFLENFNYPYIAKSITDFWRRWHISLSTWFRDYVYIPLGGNRVSRLKNYRNICVVWMLTGLWHGASWNFLLWGVYFAVLLMLEKAFLLKWLKKAPGFVGHIYTLVLVMLSWAIFAIEDFKKLGAYLGAIFCGNTLVNGAFWYDLRSYAVLLVLLAVASTPLAVRLYRRIPERIRSVLSPVLMLAGLTVSTAYLVNSTYNPFLYFRF